MRDNQILSARVPNGTADDTAVKLPYSQPVLRLYGEVRNLTQGGAGSFTEGMAGMMATMMSDRRAKENIVRIGTHPAGIGLYLFDYKSEFRDQWGRERMLGVMADEVEAVRPCAIVLHADGYKMVDYGKLN